MRERFKLKRDYYSGALMVLLGVGAAVTGSGYKVGSLAKMGPGFMPVVLGVVLAFLGILIAGTALGSPSAMFFVCIGVYAANNDMFQVGETLFIAWRATSCCVLISTPRRSCAASCWDHASRRISGAAC